MAKSYRYEDDRMEEAFDKNAVFRSRRAASRQKESRRVETLSNMEDTQTDGAMITDYRGR